MPRRWVLWALFASSYAPLFILISIRAVGQSTGLVVTCGVCALVGIGATVGFLKTSAQRDNTDLVVLKVEDRNPDVASYAATYLLPFLPVFSGRWQDYVSLVAFVALLGVVYVRSRLIYLNPLLSLVGYRLWRVVAVTKGAAATSQQTPWPRFLLTTEESIAEGDVISTRQLTNDLLIGELRPSSDD